MFDFITHRDWIKKVIESCSTLEQMECCKVLLSLFVVQMGKAGMTLTTIRSIEDELLTKWIDKYSQLMVI